MLLNIFATDSKIVLWLTNLFIQQDESFFCSYKNSFIPKLFQQTFFWVRLQ